ncbi:equilibrative nucleobase transporter 1-like [Liolophura sinensis]|uniref:equilibrative nucleobase transporter 1-like n=1 Tax=Liolophura sinensis TaxID=3198878 RepID=UPI0031598564
MSNKKYGGVPRGEMTDKELIQKQPDHNEQLKIKKVTEAQQTQSPWRKYLMAVWAVLECLLFGGLVYGWGSLVFVFKKEGIYAELCSHRGDNSSNITIPAENMSGVISCREQDEKLQLAFTVGTTLMTISSPILGHIQYTSGTRMARIVLICFFLCGSLVTAFLTTSTPWLVFLGLSCLAIGGLPIVITNIQVANLFAVGGSTVVGLLCGSFDASAAVQLVVKIAYENGISRQYSYLFISALHVMVIFSTFVLLPKTFIPKVEPDKSDLDEAGEVVKALNENDNPAVHSEELPLRDVKPSLLNCTLSRVFLSHVFWLSVLQLRFYYFIGTLNPWLNYITNQEESLVSHYTNASLFTQLGGVLTSLFCGFIYDLERRRNNSKPSITERRLQPSVVPLTLTSCLALLLSCLVLVPSAEVLYVDFIVLTFFRSFMYGTAAAFLQMVFPADYFGFLYGMLIVISGVLGCVQYPLFIWLETPPKGPQKVNIFLLVLMFVSLIHPINIWLNTKRGANNIAESEYVFIAKRSKCF